MQELESKFYTYAYLDKDNKPYYIGKGCNKRAYLKHRNVNTPTQNKIIILKNSLTEAEALKHEQYMIFIYKNCIKNKINMGFPGSITYKKEDPDEWADSLLCSIFGNKTAACILLFINKETESHALRIAKTFDFGLNQTQRQLKKLEQNYVLVSWKVGAIRLYAFNKQNPTVKNLKIFLSSCK